MEMASKGMFLLQMTHAMIWKHVTMRLYNSKMLRALTRTPFMLTTMEMAWEMVRLAHSTSVRIHIAAMY